MLRFIELLISFLMGRAQTESPPSITAMIQELLPRIRRIVTLTSLAFGACALICAGIIVALLEMAAQYDRVGSVSLTASNLVGFVFILIGVIAGYLGLKSSAWFPVVQPPRERDREYAERPSPAVEIVNALTPLVQEYLRTRNQSAPTPASSGSSGAESKPDQRS